MEVSTQLYSTDSVEVVVAIPAYNERETLPIIVKELSLFLSEKDAILILNAIISDGAGIAKKWANNIRV